MGGWVSGNQVFGFPVKNKIRTPRNTVFIHDFFRSHFIFNQLFSHALQCSAVRFKVIQKALQLQRFLTGLAELAYIFSVFFRFPTCCTLRPRLELVTHILRIKITQLEMTRYSSLQGAHPLFNDLGGFFMG